MKNLPSVVSEKVEQVQLSSVMTDGKSIQNYQTLLFFLASK